VRARKAASRRDDYTGEPFRSRAVNPDVAADRGYVRYSGADDVLDADPRLGSTKKLRDWTRHYGSRGAPGWLIRKHALPGSPFDDPLPQLRPDKAVPGRKKWHTHALAFYGRPTAREIHERVSHGGQRVTGRHFHVPESKYVLAPGPHGKRWDTHPWCTRDRFLAAERVWLHMEGALKLDALVSAGEVGADVPSVTLWDRLGTVSWADWPGGEPERRRGASFFDWYEEWEVAWVAARKAQADELVNFLRANVRAPVIIVVDRDQGYDTLNPLVALEAFSLRDAVRDAAELPCVVAAPPRGRDTIRVKGSDDFQKRGGKPLNMQVFEPRLETVPGRDEFRRRFWREHARGRSGKKLTAKRVERILELLDWYATHSVATGLVERPAVKVAARLGVSVDTVKRDTLQLEQAGALEILGAYDDPDTRPKRTAEEWKNLAGADRAPVPAIRLHEALRPAIWEPTVRAWLRAQG
jgi:hypothetical protein